MAAYSVILKDKGGDQLLPRTRAALVTFSDGKTAEAKVTTLASKALQTYTRTEIGTTPNIDDPGVNGVFELRSTSEIPNATGTRPHSGFSPILSVKDENVMMQLAGMSNTWYIRGVQKANPTMSGISWQKLVLESTIGSLKAGSATKLATARSLKTSLSSTSAASFDGSADATAIGVTGTLPVSNGGTGAATLASGQALLGNGTGALLTRAIRNATAKGSIGWSSSSSSNSLLTQNDIAYWNGRYNDNSSNLEYCVKGAFGDIVTHNWSEVASAVSSGVSGGSASSAAKLSTARKISLGGASSGSASFDGSADVTISVTNNRLAFRDNHTETASGTTANAPTAGMLDTNRGLYLTGTYNDSNTPAAYGNIINVIGQGSGQLLLGWSGSDSTTEHIYYRSHRDASTGGWGAWVKIADSANFRTALAAATSSLSGLMSATDKAKLDAITASADSVSFSRSLTSGTKVGTITINGTATDLYAPTDTNTEYTAGSGLSLSGTTINHAASVTAGTAGTSSATSGITLAVPYVTYNATGHVTAAGTHTHTITSASSSAAGLMSSTDKAKLDNYSSLLTAAEVDAAFDAIIN